MSDAAVLHVTTLPGGGVDRHVRDIARASPRAHLFWHVGESAEVIESPATRRCYPLAPWAPGKGAEGLAAWLRARGVGLVHAHSVSKRARERVDWACRALGVSAIATLHDVLFLRPDGFEPGTRLEPDPEWLAEVAAFLGRAAARIAPSEYLAGLARANLPGQEITRLANGSPPRRVAPQPAREPRPEFARGRFSQVALVLGAIGPHKGARLLEAVAHELEGTAVGIVVVGYLDAQADPGWRRPHLFVHGAWDDDEVGALARAYGARIALFPNQVPESFSYALSDVWAAGLPALVPPEGALGERVRRCGGGWLLPAGFGAREVAQRLAELLSPARAAELARVESALLREDPDRIPPLDAMSRSLEALYARFGIDASATDPLSPPAQELLARNLDGALFRQELARVADELAQVKAAIARERESAEREAAAARGWIAKLEADVAALQAELAKEVAERRRLGEENAQLAIHKSAFDRLPRFVRSYLLKKVLGARG